jgi:hypothetical protein
MKKAAVKNAAPKALPPWLNNSKMGMGAKKPLKKPDNGAAEGEMPMKPMKPMKGKPPMMLKKGGKAC